MKSKKPSKFQIFLLICLGWFVIHRVFFRAPSEAEMITTFREHKAEFEQIQLMLQQDKAIQEIGNDWVRAKWDEKRSCDLPLNVSEERLNFYRSFMKKLNLGLIISRDNDNKGKDIRLGRFGGGMTDTSWSIGYAWLKKVPQRLVKSAYYQIPSQNLHFSRIEGNWYIYHLR